MHVIFDYFQDRNFLDIGGLFVMLTMVGEVDVRLQWSKMDMLGMLSSALLFVYDALTVYIECMLN